MSERETWIFREELRDADERRDVGRDGYGSRSRRGNLRGWVACSAAIGLTALVN